MNTGPDVTLVAPEMYVFGDFLFLKQNDIWL